MYIKLEVLVEIVSKQSWMNQIFRMLLEKCYCITFTDTMSEDDRCIRTLTRLPDDMLPSFD